MNNTQIKKLLDDPKENTIKLLRQFLASVAACKNCTNSTCPRKDFNGSLAETLYDMLRAKLNF